MSNLIGPTTSTECVVDTTTQPPAKGLAEQVKTLKLKCPCSAQKQLWSSDKAAWQAFKNSRQAFCLYCDTFTIHTLDRS